MDLGINLQPRASDNISEVVAFAQGRAPFARGPDGSTAAWTTALDIVDAEPLVALGGGGRWINVRVGLPADDTLTAAWANDQIVEAQELFDENRVGIELYYAGSFTHTRVGGIPDLYGACTTVNNDLGSEPTVQQAANLYLLFVPELTSFGNPQRGWACIDETWMGRAIYISQINYTYTTIAHEIGHQLGLWTPYLEPAATHPQGPEFDEVNLMWSTANLGEAKARDQVTLGQAYRMNFDAGSWLNLRVIDPSNRVTRDCQPEAGEGACPKLSTDLGG
jgi:hypothetical protein